MEKEKLIVGWPRFIITNSEKTKLTQRHSFKGGALDLINSHEAPPLKVSTTSFFHTGDQALGT
jgi:hypothetical protein